MRREQMERQHEEERLKQQQLQEEFRSHEEETLRQRQLQLGRSLTNNEQEEERFRQQSLAEEFNVQQELLRQQQALQEISRETAEIQQTLTEPLEMEEQEKQPDEEPPQLQRGENEGEPHAKLTVEIEDQEDNRNDDGFGEQEQYDEGTQDEEAQGEERTHRVKSRIEEEVDRLISGQNAGERPSSNKRTVHSMISYTNTPNDDDGFGVLDVGAL